MDETALPILLVDMARREGILNDVELHHLWPMIRRAAGFLVCHGPVTQQDRWEEDPGYSPFTVAVEIAALLAAAEFFDIMGESSAAVYLRETADNWNDSIERWMYVQGSELAQRIGVEGYYVRVAPADESDASSPMHGFVSIKNRPPSSDGGAADSIVSPDALALVRFGLRSAKDPKIRNTVKVIDALLRVETPNGSAWHRYNNDGYGEGEDGSPFNGCGIGCAWPLLTGERAHFELARGRRDLSLALLFSFESFANDGGLLPEQIWDRADIPERELFFGQPSGSAMPLVWAHAEYVKLRRSLRDGQVFDTPPLVVQRYQNSSSPSPFVVWRFNQKSWHVITGKNLRIEVLAPSIVHWSIDKWETSNDASTRDTGVGVWIADLPSNTMKPGTTIAFTFFWTEAQHWEDTNFAVLVESDNGKITEQTSPK
jgi:glucoamylase